MPFIVFITIIIVLILFLKLNDQRVERISNKKDLEVKNIIEDYYTVDKIESIYNKNKKIELVFQDNSLKLNSNQIEIVDYFEDEKVEINAPLYNESDINNLFELILEDTFFYISKNRYESLLKSHK